jgi:hypothetical protein
MKKIAYPICVSLGVATLLSGCGKSSNPSPDTNTQAPAASAPAATNTVAATVQAVTTAATETVKATAQAAQSAVAKLATDLVSQAKATTDTQLGSIATELADKVKSLDASTGTNQAAQAALTGTVQSLVNGQDSGALSSAFQLAKSATLTPEQITLAKDVGNVASAYVVQKNFASLEGSQGDVASLVTSLRKGELTSTLVPLQNITQNAKLTDTQKTLVSSLADQYAPGLKKAADTVNQGLDTLKKLPGFGK